jgi:hypothetical protein
MKLQLDRICALVGIAVLTAGAAFGGYHYREIHLAEFAAVRAEYLYDKCMRECFTICTANKIPLDRCDCSHCIKYLER